MFLDVFSPPDHNSELYFSEKVLVPVLGNLLTFAVRHCTPIHYAAFCSLYDVAKTLAIEQPYDVNSWSFTTPLLLKLWNDHVNTAWIVRLCCAAMSSQKKDGWTTLHLASRNGHVDLACMLVEYGTDVLAQKEDGSTALYLA